MKTFSLLCAAIAFFFAAATSSVQALTSGDFTYTATATEVVITGCSLTSGTVTIPSTISSLPVKSIGSGAFSNKSGLTSVMIPNSVASIGDNAFIYCRGLTSLTIPSSVTGIGIAAFFNCSGLTSVTIPNSVTSIGTQAFCGCSGLTSVTIPNSATSIGEAAFANCSGLTSVTIPSGVTSIGSSAFSSCSSLTSLTIPDSVSTIGSGAFAGCSGLTNVTIGSGATNIGYDAFSGCAAITSLSVASLNPIYSSVDGVWFDKSKSELVMFPPAKAGSYTIPNSVTSIGPNAFTNGIRLTSVTLGNGITMIDKNTFRSCSSLVSVTIGSGVTSIGDSAFYDCSGLTSVTMGSGVTSIGDSAFFNCSGLTSVTIPDNVRSIGAFAFWRCVSLTTVTIGDGVVNIDDRAFAGCSQLTNVTIGSSVTNLGFCVFEGCPKLARIYFKGDAPLVVDFLFHTTSNTVIFYVAGTVGWTSPFGGLNTVALGAPLITMPPSNILANLGENVAFRVTAKSTISLPMTYQWRKNGMDIAGATNATLLLNNVQSANAGNYAVVVTNEYGQTTSTASLTLSQANLYTQAQYSAALQLGYDLGVQSSGGSDVLSNPNSYNLYTLDQVQTLNVGAPLLARDAASGKFKLTVKAKKSTDLVNFSDLPFSAGDAVINGKGEMEFQFASPDNAAFFRLESR